MPLTPHEITEISAAISENLRAGHACRFNQEEAEVLHGLGRAVRAHKAGEKELFVVIQIGKNVTDFVERAGRAVVWALIIGAVAFLLSGSIPAAWRFWK